MHKAANAYAAVSKAVLTGRDLEASLLINAAARLQAVHDDFERRHGELDEALAYNRKLWTVLVASATEKDNPLPAEVKRNLGNLAVFIFKQSIELMGRPRPEAIAPLVAINRDIAAGLRANAA